MIGYDTHGPQYPNDWDNVLPTHFDFDPHKNFDRRDKSGRYDPCFCELEETESSWWCPDCQEEVKP